jgi:hypothetical protein
MNRKFRTIAALALGATALFFGFGDGATLTEPGPAK